MTFGRPDTADVVMLTGDRPEVARQVAAQVGVDDVVTRCSPQEKTTRVREESADAVDIARRSRRIAVQSAAVGMGLAVVAMVAAAFTQEGIDVAMILNALRALRPGGVGRRAGALRPAGRYVFESHPSKE